MENMEFNALVLFGAGASYGSPAILPEPPPLGMQLFGVLARAYPATWGAVSNTLRTKFESHFETGMDALWATYPAALSTLLPGAPSPHHLMQDMARLFLQYRIAPGNHDLYSRFMMGLSSTSKFSGTGFATLNYEHLVEFAMQSLQLPPRVLRPHGGCLYWLRKSGRIFGTGRALGQGMNLISSRILPLSPSTITRNLTPPDEARYPCMAMYLNGKVTQMGQRYLRRAQTRFHNRVHASKTVALVGVRPWPADQHVWGPLFETAARVLYVGGRSDFDALRDRRSTFGETIFIADRFDSALDDLVRHI